MYLVFDEARAVALDGASQPHLKTLGKVTDGLGECSRDGP